MEELLGLVQLRDEGEDDVDGDGGLNPGDGGSSPAFFLFLLVSVFPPFIPSFCFLRPVPLFFLFPFLYGPLWLIKPENDLSSRVREARTPLFL